MNRLRLAREQRGISQRDLGKAMGVSAATISRYETGERKLTVEVAKRIASVLDEDWVNLFDPPGQNLIARIPGGESNCES